MAYQKPNRQHKMSQDEKPGGNLWVRREASLGVGEGVHARKGQKLLHMRNYQKIKKQIKKSRNICIWSV